jgi:hypothetical protein
MKTAVLVAPYFAPSTMPPALRMQLFARHLPEFGWHPIVLTVEPQLVEGPSDPESEKLLPKDLEIVRTGALPVGVTRRLGFSDLGLRSLPYLWSGIARLCKRRRPDLLFFSAPPNPTMTLGRMAFHRFHIPYVVDYQDPWVVEDYWKMPKSQRPPKWAMSYALSRVLEPFSLKHVSHITGVSKGTTDSVISRFSGMTEGDATEIPFGADGSEFEYLRSHPRGNCIFDRGDGLFHVSYAGVVIPAMFQTLRAIFRAVRQGLDRDGALFERLRIHFVGTTYASTGKLPFQVLPLAEEAGLQNIVTEHPARIDYLDALQVMLDSGALLLVGSDAPHYTASKVFPSILSERPILALFHRKSSIVKILQDTQAGAVFCFDEHSAPANQTDAIYEHLHQILSQPAPRPGTDWNALEGYTARTMTGRLAGVFEGALAAQPALAIDQPIRRQHEI